MLICYKGSKIMKKWLFYLNKDSLRSGDGGGRQSTGVLVKIKIIIIIIVAIIIIIIVTLTVCYFQLATSNCYERFAFFFKLNSHISYKMQIESCTKQKILNKIKNIYFKVLE